MVRNIKPPEVETGFWSGLRVKQKLSIRRPAGDEYAVRRRDEQRLVAAFTELSCVDPKRSRAVRAEGDPSAIR